MKKEINKSNHIMYCVIASTVSMLFTLCFFRAILEGDEIIWCNLRRSGIITEAAVCICFILCTILVYFIVRLLKIDFSCLNNRMLNNVVIIVSYILIVFLLHGLLVNDDGAVGADTSGFFWHKFPVWIVLLIAVAFYIITYQLVILKTKINRTILWLVFLIAAVTYGFVCVDINCFAGDMFHIDAYYHPIYNVYYNTPYSGNSFSIYGHYELFYKPVLMIFGTNPAVISISILIQTILTGLMILGCVDLLCSSDAAKILVAIILCVPNGSMFKSTTYQATPHRLIFLSAISLYAILICKKQIKWSVKTEFLGHLLCLMAFLWNTETGAVAILAWFVFSCSTHLQNNTKLKTHLWNVIKNILLCIFDACGAILVVNIYNLFVGGGLFIKEYFYPFLNKSFLQNYVIGIQFRNLPYIYLIFLGLFCLVYCVGNTSIFIKESQSLVAPAIGLLGVVILGQVSYYMTRAAYYALIIAWPFFLIIQAFLINYLVECGGKIRQLTSLDTVCRYIVGIIATFSVSLFIPMSQNMFDYIAEKKDGYAYDHREIDAQIRSVFSEFAPNTYAVGFGLDEVYGIMGWDTGYHMMDTVDVLYDQVANEVIYTKLVEQANSKENVLLRDFAYRTVSVLDDSYVLKKEVIVAGYEFGYFEKKQYKSPEVILEYEAEAKLCEVDLCNSVNSYYAINGYISMDEEGDESIGWGLLDIESADVFLLDSTEVETNYNSVPDKHYYYAKIRKEDLSKSPDKYLIVGVVKNDDNTKIALTDKSLQ